jgi:hypothetical protein
MVTNIDYYISKKYLYILIKSPFSYYLGYIFDIDSTHLNSETINCLKQWPSDDDIKDVIHSAYNEALSFSKILEITKISNNHYSIISSSSLYGNLYSFHDLELENNDLFIGNNGQDDGSETDGNIILCKIYIK